MSQFMSNVGLQIRLTFFFSHGAWGFWDGVVRWMKVERALLSRLADPNDALNYGQALGPGISGSHV